MCKKLFVSLLALFVTGISTTCTMVISHALADASMFAGHMTHTKKPVCGEQESCGTSNCCIESASKDTYVSGSSRLLLITEVAFLPISNDYQLNRATYKIKDYSIRPYIPPLIRIGITVKKE